MEEASSLVTQKLETMFGATDLVSSLPKVEAASPGQGGRKGVPRSNIDPALVSDCFDVLIRSVEFNNDRVVFLQGREQLATVFSVYFAYAFHRLSATDPKSSVAAHLRECYKDKFPVTAYPLITIDALVAERWKPNKGWRDDNRPPTREHVSCARYMAFAARIGYTRTRYTKIPRWVLRFALDSLSLDPQPPTSVVVDCLIILATDMGCHVPGITASEERYCAQI